MASTIVGLRVARRRFLAQQLDGICEGGFGCVEGSEELRVGGDLVAAQPGFLIDDELLRAGGGGDAFVGRLDGGDGLLSAADLPHQDDGDKAQREHREEQHLHQDAIELTDVHRIPAGRCLSAPSPTILFRTRAFSFCKSIGAPSPLVI